MARILVADGNPDDLQFLGDALEDIGHEVMRAGDGAEARALLELKLDLVIVDIHLAKLDGFEVIEFAKTRHRPVPAILLADRWTPAERTRTLEMGLVRLHEKPVRLERLARDIDEIVRAAPDSGLDIRM